jgi:hypothetical protein
MLKAYAKFVTAPLEYNLQHRGLWTPNLVQKKKKLRATGPRAIQKLLGRAQIQLVVSDLGLV